MRRFHETWFLGLAGVLAACGQPAHSETPQAAEAAEQPEPATPEEAALLPDEPAAGPPSAKRAPCDTDQSCNDNPAVSALWGRCVESVCQCRPGFELMPWGRCKPAH